MSHWENVMPRLQWLGKGMNFNFSFFVQKISFIFHTDARESFPFSVIILHVSSMGSDIERRGSWRCCHTIMRPVNVWDEWRTGHMDACKAIFFLTLTYNKSSKFIFLVRTILKIVVCGTINEIFVNQLWSLVLNNHECMLVDPRWLLLLLLLLLMVNVIIMIMNIMIIKTIIIIMTMNTITLECDKDLFR